MVKDLNGTVDVIIDDTDLRWYGLTEEELDKIKEEGYIDGEDVHKAVKIVEAAYRLGINLDLEDVLDLIKKNKNNEL